VKDLEVAWTYDTGETGGLQTQPIIVGGVLYALTPSHKAFALRAATGELLWTFDSGIESQGPNRGVMYWASGSDRRVFPAVRHFLYALDAETGQPIATFGGGGRIDLRANLGRDPEKQSIQLTSPGVVYKDTLIVGGRVGEGLPASPGDVRAYDARTGALRWTFHTIPHPGEIGYETWSRESWIENGGANNWAGMALDEVLGAVYVPTGSAAADFYGANRKGDNLFANSLLALDAETGKRLWHFQVVRHDILDRDLPSPPSLVTLRRDGKTVDAVAQLTKHGLVFVFDRKSRSFRSSLEAFPRATYRVRSRPRRSPCRPCRNRSRDRSSPRTCSRPGRPGRTSGRSPSSRSSRAKGRSRLSPSTAERWSFPGMTAVRSGVARRSIRRPVFST
jgi:quinoprotein glucose dehydrogenase